MTDLNAEPGGLLWLARGMMLAAVVLSPQSALGQNFDDVPDEPVARYLSFKLPLTQPRFHWRFLDQEAFLAGRLTIRIVRDGIAESLTVFDSGEITEGWNPIAHQGPEIYFGFSSTTSYLTSPRDSLEIELLVVEDLDGIGSVMTGVLARGTYFATGSFALIIDPAPSGLSMEMRQRLSVEILSMLEPQAFMECWRQTWDLRPTGDFGWMPPGRGASMLALLERADSAAEPPVGSDGRPCRIPS